MLSLKVKYFILASIYNGFQVQSPFTPDQYSSENVHILQNCNYSWFSKSTNIGCCYNGSILSSLSSKENLFTKKKQFSYNMGLILTFHTLLTANIGWFKTGCANTQVTPEQYK